MDTVVLQETLDLWCNSGDVPRVFLLSTCLDKGENFMIPFARFYSSDMIFYFTFAKVDIAKFE